MHSLCGRCHEAAWRGILVGIQSGRWCPRCALPHGTGGTTASAQLPPTWRSSPSPSKCICVRSAFGAAALWRPDRATATALSPAITTWRHAEIQRDQSNHPNHFTLYLMEVCCQTFRWLQLTSITFSGSSHSACENHRRACDYGFIQGVFADEHFIFGTVSFVLLVLLVLLFSFLFMMSLFSVMLLLLNGNKNRITKKYKREHKGQNIAHHDHYLHVHYHLEPTEYSVGACEKWQMDKMDQHEMTGYNYKLQQWKKTSHNKRLFICLMSYHNRHNSC